MSDDLNGNRYFPTQTALPETQENLRLHVGLFLATAYTTTVAGMFMSPQLASIPMFEDWRIFDPRYLVYGLPFSMTLLIILSVHEMGHYVTSRWWGVRASLPYFIPFPSLIGTLGAVIKLRSQIPNRRALIDIGASGPIAGFVMSVIAWGVGLHMSKVVEARDVAAGTLALGHSLLSGWLGNWVIGDLPEGHTIMLHPVALAGWLGLFVTVLNLLPMGQFDGGHIVYAIFGEKHRLISRATMVGLALMWLLAPPYHWLDAESMFRAWYDSRWVGWLVWLGLAALIGRHHPHLVDPDVALDPARRWMGYASLAIFILCFIPNPIQIY